MEGDLKVTVENNDSCHLLIYVVALFWKIPAQCHVKLHLECNQYITYIYVYVYIYLFFAHIEQLLCFVRGHLFKIMTCFVLAFFSFIF